MENSGQFKNNVDVTPASVTVVLCNPSNTDNVYLRC